MNAEQKRKLWHRLLRYRGFKVRKQFLEGINKYNSRFCLALTNTWKKPLLPWPCIFYGLLRQEKQLRDCDVNLLTVLQKNQACEWGLWKASSLWRTVFCASREWIPFSVKKCAWYFTEDRLKQCSTPHMLRRSSASLSAQQNWANAGVAALGNYFPPYVIWGQRPQTTSAGPVLHCSIPLHFWGPVLFLFVLVSLGNYRCKRCMNY